MECPAAQGGLGFLGKQMVAEVANNRPQLERFFLNQFSALLSLRAELFKLQQFCVGQNHSDAVIHIVQPFSHLGIIHGD